MLDKHLTDGAKVMTLLRPNGGWTIIDSDYNSITYHNCEVVTLEEFENTIKNLSQIIKKQNEADKVAKAAAEAKLAALGLDADDLKALGLI